jgi:hypothetical protein
LDSVLAQTFKDYEIIVVNDGSPDSEELEKVLEPYRDRIVYLRQENQGVSAARNTGIRAARGEYIAPLDADDMWAPEHLAAQLAVLEADPSIDVVICRRPYFRRCTGSGQNRHGVISLRGRSHFRAAGHVPVHGTPFVSVSAAGARCSAPGCSIRRYGAEDIDMWLRIARQGGRIVYQRRVLGHYRRHAGSLSADPVDARRIPRCTGESRARSPI